MNMHPIDGKKVAGLKGRSWQAGVRSSRQAGGCVPTFLEVRFALAVTLLTLGPQAI